MLIAQNETESKIPYIEIQSIIYNMTHSGPVYFTSYACLCLDLYLFGFFFQIMALRLYSMLYRFIEFCYPQMS